MGIARAVKNVFLVAGRRTAFGAYGKSLLKYTSTDLQEIANRAVLEAAGVDAKLVEHVVVGMVSQSSRDAAYISRHASLRVGVPIETPALTVNRLCGSGFQAVVNAAQDVTCGDADIILTGGAENMSQAPHVIRGARFGIPLGVDLPLEDIMWHTLIDYGIKTPMGMTAENLAEKYKISREECDKFALESVRRWKEANDAGYFKEEIVPITIKTPKGEKVFDTDEHPRPGVTIEQLAKLPTVFKKGGVVSAANASGICDGAGAVLVASEDAVNKHNLKPLARLVGYGISGCDPSIMGIGPAPAIRGLLNATGHKLNDIDLIEVNEAFAPQVISVQKELGLDPEKVNVNGGAIALGHPVGASGARITAHLLYEMKRRGAKTSIGSACIGGGQGIALLLESIS